MSTRSQVSDPGSPFFERRFEREAQHLYYLPQPLFEDLERPVPTYLIGSRGTGKTTLLKALSWNERLHSPTLRQQMGDDPFSTAQIGVYLKLPEYQLAALEEWLSGVSEALRTSVLGIYFELLWIELLLDAVSELMSCGILKARPHHETSLVHTLVHQHRTAHPGSSDFIAVASPASLRELGAILRRQRHNVDSGARWEDEPRLVLKEFPEGQLGYLSRAWSDLLAGFCNTYGAHARRGRWHFKICMDEGECLTTAQRCVLNTLVRLAAYPLYPVVSFVAVPDALTHTCIPNLTLTDADRQLVLLDDHSYMSDAAFKAFAEGVATIRIQNAVRQERAFETGADVVHPECPTFNISAILGKLNINALIAAMANESSAKSSKDLLAKAADLAQHPFFAEKRDSPGEETAAPPLYQAYLMQRLGIALPAPQDPAWTRRAQDSAELRKRMVAAYLAICEEWKFNVRYAFDQMALQMSDCCIRDFLSIMHELFVEASVPLQDFLSTRMPVPQQDRAMRRASKKKRDSVNRAPISCPSEAGRLIHGLGIITHVLQTEGRQYRHLRSPERGEFVLKLTQRTRLQAPLILALLQDSAEAGFLRAFDTHTNTWRFRVHTSLAAEYEFSYRGTQYPTPMDIESLESLASAIDEEAVLGTARRIGQVLAGIEDDAPLFEGLSQ